MQGQATMPHTMLNQPGAFWLDAAPLLLASGSATRRQMLAAAGLPVEARPADVDERRIESASLAAGAGLRAIAGHLAAAKALAVSAAAPGRLVLGADLTLILPAEDGADVMCHKPADVMAARAQLEALAGRTHQLTSAFALARDGVVLASGEDHALMTMRPLSADFLDAYLAAMGDGVLASVGCYRLEETGSQLFSAIDGDHFTILGLPLLPVLAALRQLGALRA